MSDEKTLFNCVCLGEYERNLLISALAEYKSSLQSYAKGLYDEFVGSKEFKDEATKELINILLQRSTNIDSVIKDIEGTPVCVEVK